MPVTLSLAIVLLALGAYAWSARRIERTAPPPGDPPASDYDRSVARLDRDIDVARRYADAEPRSWMRRSQVAALYLSRARLTGDPGDREAGDAALEAAFREAAPGSGPLLVRASARASVHRFDEAEVDLTLFVRGHRSSGELAEARALLADIALARGQVDDAIAGYEEALAIRRDASILVRLAGARFRAGDSGGAERDYDDALSLLRPIDRRERAALLVSRGEMDLARGDFAGARRRYEQAERTFSGWWLVSEHLAALDGGGGSAAPLE